MGELEQFETDEEVGLSYAAQAMADEPEMQLVSGPKRTPSVEQVNLMNAFEAVAGPSPAKWFGMTEAEQATARTKS